MNRLFTISLTALVVVLIVGVTPARGQVVSPGKLADPHAHLEGSQNCEECHANRGRVEPSRCLACHDALNDRIKQGKGYHATRGDSRCGKCHQDHRGRDFDIVRWPTTATTFNHDLARYRLRDSHAKVKCRDCHKPGFQTASKVKRWPTARRQRTYLGLEQTCTSCHEDEHEGRLGKTCIKCHDETAFKGAARFDHDKSKFPLKGAHQQVACDDCHKQPGRTPEVLYVGLEFKTCGSCHDDPHKGAMADRSNKTECETCHTNVAWDRIIYRKADHSPRRMPLRGGHAQPRCTDCHGQKATKRPSAACVSCHTDVHNNRFGQDCQRCHDVSSWHAKPRPPRAVPKMRLDANARLGLTRRELSRVEFHQKTRFPLEGLHVRVKCQECHPRRGSFKKRFQQIKHDACSDCHKDVHEGQFDKSRCRDCHTTDGWPLTTYSVAKHQGARFVLDGSHRGVACAVCHGSARSAATRYRFDDRSCQSCHKDRHDGQFSTAAGDKRPVRGCEDCHDTKAFTNVAFDHEQTRFSLQGAHENTVCDSCHQASASARPASPGGYVGDGIVYRGLGSECESCHRDDHQGQFRKQPKIRGCAECHTQTTFEIDGFDHDQRTEYKLDGKHTEAKCDQCHQKITLNGGDEVRLYRVGQPACSACHNNRHTGRAERMRGPSKNRLIASGKDARAAIDACETCHSTVGWETLARQLNGGKRTGFDHSDVGYTLNGGHRAATCDQCHTPTRKLTRQCSGCHQDRHAGRLGTGCADCHQITSWRSTDIRDKHRATRLPLTGGHALADCTSCHPRDRQGQYLAVPAACIGCHLEDYTAPATHPDHVQAGFGAGCEECHRPAGWSPAYFAHTTFPLRGAHRTASCSSCHDRDPAPRDCIVCHIDDRDRTVSPNHRTGGFSSDCTICHTETAWVPANYPLHEDRFPIARGNHSGFACSDCHTDPNSATDFTCLEPCHTRSDMDDEHDDVNDYLYESRACLECHPDGRE